MFRVTVATAKKLGNRVGAAEWEALESVADVKRFLRWVILSMRDTTLEPNHASIFAQIGGVIVEDHTDRRFREDDWKTSRTA